VAAFQSFLQGLQFAFSSGAELTFLCALERATRPLTQSHSFSLGALSQSLSLFVWHDDL
jgi:hypothetical protein